MYDTDEVEEEEVNTPPEEEDPDTEETEDEEEVEDRNSLEIFEEAIDDAIYGGAPA